MIAVVVTYAENPAADSRMPGMLSMHGRSQYTRYRPISVYTLARTRKGLVLVSYIDCPRECHESLASKKSPSELLDAHLVSEGKWAIWIRLTSPV